jgi:hypothetical protein
VKVSILFICSFDFSIKSFVLSLDLELENNLIKRFIPLIIVKVIFGAKRKSIINKTIKINATINPIGIIFVQTRIAILRDVLAKIKFSLVTKKIRNITKPKT